MTYPSLIELQNSLKTGVPDIERIQAALNDSSPYVQYEVYQLLRSCSHPIIDQVLRHYRFWQHFEGSDYLFNEHAQMFANRPVVDVSSFFRHQEVEGLDCYTFDIEDSRAIAYGIRQSKWGWHNKEESTCEEQLVDLLLSESAHPIEALVFGYWGGDSSQVVVDCLVREKVSLPDLKALFLGDIEDQEDMISSIEQTDLRSVLEAFPKLEILQVRGDRRDYYTFRQAVGDNYQTHPGLRFGQGHHDHLNVLKVETGGLNRYAVRDICASHWPALEYLELWFGSEDYGSTSSVDDVLPILSGEAFPTLKYLGLRNCEFADELAIALAQFPPHPSLIELDFSLGTLSDVGAEALLNSPILDSLMTLNLSRCYLSKDIFARLSELNCSVEGKPLNSSREQISKHIYRRCSVAE